MKKTIFLILAISFTFLATSQTYNFAKQNKINNQNTFRELLHSNKYYHSENNIKSEYDEEDSPDRPDLGWEQDYLMTLDPALGYVPYERKIQAINIAKQKLALKTAIPGTNWTERGPNNVGGRTRALMFDPNDATNSYKKLWAGGVTGGLWYNTDITSNTSWIKVNDFWDNIAVTCIVYDPSNTDIFYVGTGEGWGTGAARGAGIWKTSDAGLSWARLSSTDNSDFYYVQKIQVTSTGRVLAATSQGLYISDDNGSSWSQKISGFSADIEIASNGDIYVSMGRIYHTPGKIYKSVDGGTNFSDITPSGGSPERIELGVAPSNSSVIYAVSSNGNDVEWFKKSTNGGSSWSDITIPMYLEQSCSYGTQDFTRSQAWYDLIITVKPDDPNTVFVGGIDVNKSTDGGSSWSAISYWTGSCHPYVHADQHAMTFRPGSNSEAVFGCDGGVFYSSDAGTSSSPSFDEKNNDYNVTQFYSCAIKNVSAGNYFLAGAQDNGSHKFVNPGINSTTTVSGGDGAFCFIDQDDPTYQLTSYVYNSWYRSTNGGSSFSSISSSSTGKFINPSDYDNNADILYAADDADKIYRISGISGTTNIDTKTVGGDAIGGDQASHIRVSDYSNNVLFIGSETGNIYRVTNANTNPVSTDIDPSGTLPTGNISCIEIGASENDLLVTFSNYGLVSVWETHDGGTTWTNKEGNLPDMPVRWALYNPNDRNQVLLATDVGVWSTTDISVASPDWSPTSTGLANVRCDMLQIRDADNLVAVATYGRGLFTSDVFASPEPVAAFSASLTTACPQDTVVFTDESTKSPTTWSWTFTPSTVTYVNGTNSNSQNPEVIFNSAGTYTVELYVTNSYGNDTETKTNYITVSNTCEYAMSDDTVYTCDGHFYDSGFGTSDYLNDEDYVMTFYPTTAGAKLEANFSSFDVENETNCNYDFLKIYDGTNTSATQIGTKYCGTNSPGVVTATNPSGALTFEWHSDGGVVASGWEATLQCVGNIAPTANFNSNVTSTCDGVINFNDISTGAPDSWEWDFGDGGTSTQQNPTYTYLANGVYTVTLIASNSSGSDTLIQSNYITVNSPSAPSTVGATNCGPGSVTLTASGTGTLQWYDSSTGGNLINTGSSYSTPVISTTTNYYVENHEYQSSQYDTPNDNTIGSGGYYTNVTSHFLIFDALADFRLISVKVFANGAGNRTIVLRNNSGDTLQQLTTNFPDGESRITLNWNIPTGTDYELALNSNPNVYRNTSGGTYPYTVTDLVSITGDSYSPDYYYYFYNWEVAKDCISPRTEVTATIENPLTPTVSISESENNICAGTNVIFTASPTNEGSSPTYQWQLNGSNVGSGTSTYSNSSLSNGDVVTCILTSSESCVTSATANSNSITMVVNSPLTPTVSISESENNICAGTNVIFTASSTNEGSSPTYQWQINGSNVGSGTSTYSNSSLSDGDIVTCILTSSESCVTSATANSNSITMVVNSPLTPTVSISESENNSCVGTNVVFTASPTNEGSSPTYQWQLNGSNVGSGTSTYSNSSLSDGDVVTCILNSSESCVTSATANSNSVTMVVNTSVTPAISISESENNICVGTNVIFTASPTNEGSSPTYQWQLNGSNVGSGASTYSNSSLSDGDVISCTLTSSMTCSTVNPVNSNSVTMVVNTSVTPALSISESENNICSGTNVIFTASPTNEGSSPTYQWQLNGSNIGTGASTYSNSSLSNGDVISCTLTSSMTCSTVNPVNSNSVTMVVNTSVTPAVSISESENDICDGTNVIFTASPTNEGSSPTYQWQLNGSNVGSGTSTYSNSSLSDGDVVTCILTSSESCVTSTTANSNTVTMVVNPNLVSSINISESGNNICSGTNVMFTASSTNEGSSPTYQWQLNGSNVGSGTSTYSNSSLSDGDIVTCILTSSETCVTTNPISSNSVTMAVNTSVTPALSISESENNICIGTNVTFTASPTNEGSSPTYQWQLNGSNVGSGLSTYSNSSLSDGDVVTCILTSNETCVTSTTANSNPITMVVSSIPAQPITTSETACYGSVIPALTSTGSNVEWYSNSALTNLVYTGNNYVTGQTGAGTFTYYVVDNNNGCKSPASTSILTIINAQTPLVNYDWVCGSGSVTLTASGQGTIYWYTSNSGGSPIDSGASFNTPNINYTTNYYAESNVSGCASNSRGLGLAIVYHQPQANFNFSTNNLEVSFINNSTNSDTYFWDFDDGYTSSIINPIHNYTQPQIYNVMLVADNPCYVDTIYKLVDLMPLSLGLDISNNFIELYPNPANTFIRISSSRNVLKSFIIVDVYGRQVKQNVENQISFIVNIDDLPSGVYFIKLKTNDGIIFKKFIKK